MPSAKLSENRPFEMGIVLFSPMTVAVPLSTPDNDNVGVLAAILFAAGKHVVLVVMELRHRPDGWIGADEAVREWCVEHWRKLRDELVRALYGGAHCRICRVAQAVLCLVGATEAVVEVDDAPRPCDDAVPHRRPDFSRLNGPGPLRRRLGERPAHLHEIPDRLAPHGPGRACDRPYSRSSPPAASGLALAGGHR